MLESCERVGVPARYLADLFDPIKGRASHEGESTVAGDDAARSPRDGRWSPSVRSMCSVLDQCSDPALAGCSCSRHWPSSSPVPGPYSSPRSDMG